MDLWRIYLPRLLGQKLFWRDGYSKQFMVGVCGLTDFLLINCAVCAEEHGLLGMVHVERGAWLLVMSQQPKCSNTKPTDYTKSDDKCGGNCPR